MKNNDEFAVEKLEQDKTIQQLEEQIKDLKETVIIKNLVIEKLHDALYRKSRNQNG